MATIKSASSNLDLDAILDELGFFGKYQIRTLIFISIPIFFSSMYSSEFIFNAEEVKYRCEVPVCESSPPKFDTQEWYAWAYPSSGGKCALIFSTSNNCTPDSFNTTKVLPCDSWIYENKNALIAEFNLACNDWKRTLIGSIKHLGLFISMPLASYLSDKFGRRITYICSVCLTATIGLAQSFATSYMMYIVLGLLASISGAEVYNIGFLIAVESVSEKRRVLTGNIVAIIYAIGQTTLGLLAWAVPYWRSQMQIMYGPSIFFASLYFISEESMRWLLIQGRKKEVVLIIRKAAEMNKVGLSQQTISSLTTNEDEKQDSIAENILKSRKEKNDNVQTPLLELLKSKVLIVRLAICSFWWIATTFAYFGLTINSVSLGGNKYMNYILSSLVEIPGYVFSSFTLDKFGRRSSIMVTFFVSGLALLGLPYVPTSLHWIQTGLNMVGKMCISMVYTNIHIYTAELFPTNARQRLIGISFIFGMIGSVVAPQTPLLMEYSASLPYILFGVLSISSGILTMMTPETQLVRLPDTLKQAENIDIELTALSTGR